MRHGHTPANPTPPDTTKAGVIYVIFHWDNRTNAVYVGQTRHTILKRFQTHISAAKAIYSLPVAERPQAWQAASEAHQLYANISRFGTDKLVMLPLEKVAATPAEFKAVAAPFERRWILAFNSLRTSRNREGYNVVLPLGHSTNTPPVATSTAAPTHVPTPADVEACLSWGPVRAMRQLAGTTSPEGHTIFPYALPYHYRRYDIRLHAVCRFILPITYEVAHQHLDSFKLKNISRMLLVALTHNLPAVVDVDGTTEIFPAMTLHIQQYIVTLLGDHIKRRTDELRLSRGINFSNEPRQLLIPEFISPIMDMMNLQSLLSDHGIRAFLPPVLRKVRITLGFSYAKPVSTRIDNYNSTIADRTLDELRELAHHTCSCMDHPEFCPEGHFHIITDKPGLVTHVPALSSLWQLGRKYRTSIVGNVTDALKLEALDALRAGATHFAARLSNDRGIPMAQLAPWLVALARLHNIVYTTSRSALDWGMWTLRS